jgi:hypothetical protein
MFRETQVKESEMSVAYSLHAGDENCMHNLGGKPEERVFLGDLVVDEKTILK